MTLLDYGTSNIYQVDIAMIWEERSKMMDVDLEDQNIESGKDQVIIGKIWFSTVLDLISSYPTVA